MQGNRSKQLRTAEHKARAIPVVEVVAGNVSHADGVVRRDVCTVGLSELKAWGPAIAGYVVDLPGDLVLGQRWEEGQGLKEPADRIVSG